MIQIFTSTNGQYYYTISGYNNKILVTSETFTRKENAIKGAKALVKLITDAAATGAPEPGLLLKDMTI